MLLFSATYELTCSYKQYIICLATRCLNLWINSNLSETVTENKNKRTCPLLLSKPLMLKCISVSKFS